MDEAPLATFVVLGGLGDVGALFARSLAAGGMAVAVVDRRPCPAGAAGRFLHADATGDDEALRRLISAADCVIACLPAGAALAAVDPVVGAMRSGALWIDTLSVKTEICRALRGHRDDIEILSINPLFAPALGWRGNPVAAVELTAGPRSASMIGILASWGARIGRASAGDHDALTAAVQVATHAAVLAFGSVLLELGYEAELGFRLGTPPHRLLLALLSRIVNANPAVYWEIQRQHPQGEDVRQAMARALAALSAAAREPAPDGLRRQLAEIARLLAPEQGPLRELGDRIVALAAVEADARRP